MTRRHNRHFYLDDNLTRCSGKTKYREFQCSNWGKPDALGIYWCHIHKGKEKADGA
jgi:hypothetical protein